MNIFWSELLLLVTIFSASGLLSSDIDDANERLQQFLKNTLDSTKYDKRVMPGSGTVAVNVSMYILDISRIDENNKEFHAQFYFRQSWFDARLKHTGYPSESIILQDVDKIWTPDLFFVNEKMGSFNKVLQPNVFCRIDPDGKVLFSVRITERLSCSMNLRKFPHDTQHCEIRAESYGFTRKKMTLNWINESALGITSNITEDEFNVIEVHPDIYHTQFTTGEYTALTVRMKFQRKFGYFARRLYAPFTILVFLSWLPLWIKAKEKYLRLTMLLVILYLMVTIASELEPNIPKTPYTKASDVWTGFCEAMVFAAFLEFIATCIVATEAEESRYKRKGEILPTLDPDGKESEVNEEKSKSTLSKFITMFEARSGGRGIYDLSSRIDRISRILFPLVFILFNIVYWAICCSS